MNRIKTRKEAMRDWGIRWKAGIFGGLFFAAVLMACQSPSGNNEKSGDKSEPAASSSVQETGNRSVKGTADTLASDTSAAETSASDTSASAAEATDAKAALLVFKKDTHEFGTVKEGVKVEHEYVFTNTGNAPLILSQVTASCGCTTPEYSRQPIAPGKEGRIKVVFDSNGQVGKQHKIITVMSNARDGLGLLHLRGEVKPK